jgi:carboxymethylenebutenolidase
VEAGLSKAGVPYRLVTYAGAMHAFFNDTRPNYHAEASSQAWHDTLDWFATHFSA